MHFIINNLRPADTAVCAGVATGLHLMACSRQCGVSGIVIGLEPQPDSAQRARANIALNDPPQNIRIVTCGPSDGAGYVEMAAAPDENRGWASLLSRDLQNRTFFVATDTLPNLCEQLDVAVIDLMVLDIEGWELPILSTFSPQFRPTTLVVEMHPYFLDTPSLPRDDFLARLHEIGYSTFTLNSVSVADWSERLPEDNVIATVFSHDEVTWNSSSIDE